ncbi:MFS transporter [Ruminococcus sp. CLA-AA-H200]|uniref:MFS transporter n=1 Tax=Ruminococcus turbiniformis TaxID=2881258 RepID=A0ABS8FWS8_9FIRM|nr:MFS transporter [Ruminococcus turbiniformis]MCC2254481.1 MFS transporter [Ruminococcus turbiniformis]
METKLVNPTKKQWFMLVLCVIAGSIAPFFQYCHGTLTDYIMETYNITYSQVGIVNTAYSWACGIGLFIVGSAVEKKGCKFFTMLGIAIMIVGHALFYFSPSYPILIFARIVSGFGNACIYNAAYTLAVHWFAGTNKMGVATGGMTAADGIGTFCALYLFSILVNNLGIQTGNIAVIIFVAVILIILIMILKDPGVMDMEDSGATVDDTGKYEKALNSNTIAHCIAVTGVLGGLGIANYWGPSMLTDLGMSSSAAGLASTVFSVAGIFASLIFGAISDKMGTRRPSILFGGIGMVAGYLLMIAGNQMGIIWVIVAGFLCTGFCAYVVYPLGFAVLSDTTVSSKIGMANGIIQGVSFIFGMFVFQQIVGVVRDFADSYAIGLIFCAALTFVTNVVLVRVFVRDKDEVAAEMAKNQQSGTKAF